MSPHLRAALYAQAGAVFSLHPCLYAGDRPTAGRSRFATLLPGDAAVSPSNGDHAGTQRADPPPPRNGPKHRGAGRSRSATGPPHQSRSTRQFFCAEVLVAPALESIERATPIRPGEATLIGRAALQQSTVHIVDAWTDPTYAPKQDARLGGFRSMLAVPLVREGVPIGMFSVARHAVDPFTPQQISRIDSFADQAVIAIENARLFEESQQRAAELEKSNRQKEQLLGELHA